MTTSSGDDSDEAERKVGPSLKSRRPCSRETGRNCADLPEDRPIYYRSDADMSIDEIILGLMEISALSLPDEPHKYHSAPVYA
jgi:hypothetical protein